MSVARQCCLLGMPLLTMHIFDGVMEAHNLDTLAVLSIAFVVALVMAGVLAVRPDFRRAGPVLLWSVAIFAAATCAP
jgi:ABC-type protease/lipase transport system fused ATPase/permease subunit